MLETLHAVFPETRLDLLVRKGNEGVFKGHPFLGEVLVWDKQRKKYGSLAALMNKVRSASYDIVVNLHRFASSGALTAYSNAPIKLGFQKNPMHMFST